MERTVGHRNGKIILVSDTEFRVSGVDTVPVPASITASDEELIQSWRVFRNQLWHKDQARPSGALKLALISNWGTACGIAEYAKNLVAALGPLFADVRIFAEADDSGHQDDAANVTRCWRRGRPVAELIDAVIAYSPDCVLVQHEYGIWPDARIWLSLMTQLRRYHTVVTLHSVYKDHHDKTLCELACPSVVVHSASAKDVLMAKRLHGTSVNVIPHGTLPLDPTPTPWNMYRTEHTFTQFGFGFKYKGWETSLDVAARINRIHPDSFFTGIFTESPFNRNLHDTYFDALLEEIDRLGARHCTSVIRTPFLDDTTLIRAVKMSRLAVFPYIENGAHTVYSSSGAARTAMRAGLPVIVSTVPLFDDLEGVCPRASTTAQLLDFIDEAWTTPGWGDRQLAAQASYMAVTAWPVVAEQYADVLSR